MAEAHASGDPYKREPDRPVDPAKIKPGDTVMVRCKVLSGSDTVLCVETDDGEPQEFDVYTSAVVGHVPLDGPKAP